MTEVVFCQDTTEAERLVLEILADAGDRPVGLDFETAPNSAAVERLALLKLKRSEVLHRLRERNKAKAPAGELAELERERKRLTALAAYAKTAGLDPYRARVRLMQLYGGGAKVAVIDLDWVGEAAGGANSPQAQSSARHL
jgi:hypothetical protein